MKKVNLLLRWSTLILPSFKITYLLFSNYLPFAWDIWQNILQRQGKARGYESTQKLLLELLATLPVGYFRCVCRFYRLL